MKLVKLTTKTLFIKVSKYYYGTYNAIPVWKQMLREEFNWPPKRRGKGSKKQAKQKKEMNLSEYKAIYIQKYREKHPKSDDDLVTKMTSMFLHIYQRDFRYLNAPRHCTHPRMRSVLADPIPIRIRKLI